MHRQYLQVIFGDQAVLDRGQPFFRSGFTPEEAEHALMPLFANNAENIGTLWLRESIDGAGEPRRCGNGGETSAGT